MRLVIGVVLCSACVAFADGASVRFGAQKKIEWKGYVGTAPRLWGADLDQDGDLDLLVKDAKTFTWVENTGGGAFVHRDIDPKFPDPQHVAFGDLDQDGDFDVVATSGCHASQACAGVSWFENLSKGRAFERHPLTKEGISAVFSSVGIGDVDGDGKPDIILADKGLKYFRNEGKKKFAAADELENGGREYKEIVVGDLDGDKDADVVAFTGRNLFAYFNEKGALTEKSLTGESEEAVMSLVDLTADGLPDLLINWGTGVEVQENVGGKAFAPEPVVPKGGLYDIFSASPGDFDGDGDLDLLIGRGSDTKWIENDKGEWKKEEWPVFTHQDLRPFLFAGDVDKDGDPDVLGLLRDGPLVWVELKGKPAKTTAKAKPGK